jgi:tetratricopeptide (TPR) repeat protein
MPKQRRAAASRSPARPVAKKSSPIKRKAPKALTLSKGARASKPPASRPSGPKVRPPVKAQRVKAPVRTPVAGRVRVLPPKPPEAKEAPAPAPAPRRPAFYEALAVYETGVRALQRHDFEAAASSLRTVIQGYPGERELVERARLYLQVCERETARRPSGPQTASESVYAATVALNAGDVEGALKHLSKALERAPESDHAHYIMAVALVDRGDTSLALVHLRQAITLNPENRSVALQDPDLGALHELDAFRDAIDAPGATLRRRIKARR